MAGRFMGSDEELRDILSRYKVVAVVGLSNKPQRDGFLVGKYLLKHGYKVIPVNPMYQEVLGEKAYPDLVSLPYTPEIVDCFRKKEAMFDVVEDAIRSKAKVVWAQFGAGNLEALQRAVEAGLDVVVERCIMREYKRLFGERGRKSLKC